jgi:exonuclease SbcD
MYFLNKVFSGHYQENHDAESRITRRLTLPPKARELPTDKPDTIRLDELRVAIHGQGYADQAVTRNLAAYYPPPVPDYFNIGVLHTALNGREGHLPYAPCAADELIARGFDYWALGHVHKRESVEGTGRVRMEFPGNIQGRNIRETGAKGCLLVTVDDSGKAQSEFQALDVFRWAEAPVNAQAAATVAEALDTAAEAIDDARQEAEGRPLAVRIRLACVDEVYQKVAENLEHFRFELASRIDDDVWVEKVKPELVDQAQEGGPVVTGDAATELRATLADLRSDPEAIEDIFADGDCGKLRKVLDEDLRGTLDAAHHHDIFELATVLLSGTPAQEGE